jgi:CspA family cold shock protein
MLPSQGFSLLHLFEEDLSMRGKVKRLVKDRGFGFVVTEGKKDIFFHRSALQGNTFDTLKEGDSVEFTVEEGPKGPRAVQMKVVS